MQICEVTAGDAILFGFIKNKAVTLRRTKSQYQMVQKLINKKFVFLLLAALFSFNNMTADESDTPTTKPIILKSGTGSSNNTSKPKAPSSVRISAYYDGSSIVVTSTVAVMAEVVIADASSGACLFSGQTALAPDFSCQVPAISGSSLKIIVTVGATVYEGTLYK